MPRPSPEPLPRAAAGAAGRVRAHVATDRAILCLVTDRRRLVPGDDRFDTIRRRLTEQAREAAEAGVDLIQVREHGLETAQLADLVATLVDAVRASTMRVVVNDRLDVALACGADGVHLRGDSIPPRLIRPIVAEGFLVGRSVHLVEEARLHASSVDYLVAGTVFPTQSKASAQQWLDAAGLAEIVRAAQVPVLGIGGISLDRVASLVAAGAAGVAAIGLFLPGATPMARLVQMVRAKFDTVATAS